MKTFALRDYLLAPIDNFFMGVLIEYNPTTNFPKYTPIIVVVIGDEYVNAFNGQIINFSENKFWEVEPFENYYTKNDYTFVTAGEKIFISLFSLEPFKRYSKRALQNLR